MRKHSIFKRVISMLLICFLMISLLPITALAAEDDTPAVEQEVNDPQTEKIDTALPNMNEPSSEMIETEEAADPDEIVRVSIVLGKDSTLAAGYSAQNIAKNVSARSYRNALRAEQAATERRIERTTGEELDVVWNLTLAANIISANVRRGDIEKIAAVSGVKDVVEERQYAPARFSRGGEMRPNMAVSSNTTGSSAAWTELELTGKGSLIAIIDTGLDVDHISFDNDAFLESVGGTGSLKLTKDKLAAAIRNKDLNITKNEYGYNDETAENLYVSDKIPFGFNYIDKDLRLDHMDGQTEHGSHVAGIAAANRLVDIDNDGEYEDAISTVGAAGNAPDAQIMVMKVFGSMGGAYDSDYFAALEDAICLGADAANVSLGGSDAGMATSTYDDLLDELTRSGTILVTSHGNNYSWGENSDVGNLYKDDVNYATGSDPATYTNTMAVASVENDGFVGAPIVVKGKDYGYAESIFENEPITTLDTSPDGSGTTYDFVFIDGIGEHEQFESVAAELEGKIAICRRGEIDFYLKAEYANEFGAVATIVVNNEPSPIGMELSDYKGPQPYISIGSDAGAEIWEAYEDTVNTTEDGLEYVTGEITICNKQKTVIYHNTNHPMSDFSSWGVTGDLALKPEITAPGGNIWSVHGANDDTGMKDHNQYEIMSGTSMAAPQISGITALVQQRLREDNIENSNGSYYRLTNALLMSTAMPNTYADGKYSSVLQQGAGVVNAYGAVTTPVYITMAGRTDGKVKAELGDDPARKGEYTVNFVLNNFSDEAQSYTLSAALFTQEIDDDFMTEDTQELEGTVTFSGGSKVTVGANDTAPVTATIRLDRTAAEELDELKKNTGFYVEGFIFATPDDEDGVALSLPVLGYYGSWTDPSMFDNDGDYFGVTSGLRIGDDVTGLEYSPRPGDKIIGMRYSLIRNAATGAVIVSYEQNGQAVKNVIMELDSSNAQMKATYCSASGDWKNTSYNLIFSWDPTSIPNGAENLKVSVVMVPEYYANENGTYDIDALIDGDPTNGELGDGAYLSVNVELDKVPPVIEDETYAYDGDGHPHIYATVSDDKTVVEVSLYESDGTTLVRKLGINVQDYYTHRINFNETAPNEEREVDFDRYYNFNDAYAYYNLYYETITDNYLTPGTYYIEAVDAGNNKTRVPVEIEAREGEFDTAELEATIQKAKEAIAGDASEQYTEQSVAALNEAIKSAEKTLWNARTQEEIDAAAETLNAAIDALEEKEVEPVTVNLWISEDDIDGFDGPWDSYTVEKGKPLSTVLEDGELEEPNPDYNGFPGGTFLGWYTLDGELFNVDAPVTEDTDLVAKFRAAGEADKDALEDAVEGAKALEEDDYTSASWAAMQEALEAANGVLDDPDATQEEVDGALAALNDAVDALEEKEVEPVTVNLWISEDDIDGFDGPWDSYTVEKGKPLSTVLEDGELEEPNPDYNGFPGGTFLGWYTLDGELFNVDAPVTEDTDLVAKFRAAGEVDKDALEKAVEEAEALDEDDYTSDSWAAMKEALEAANGVLDDPDATQEEVDGALAALNDAVDALEEKEVEPVTVNLWISEDDIDGFDGPWDSYTVEKGQSLSTVLEDGKLDEPNPDYNGFPGGTFLGWYTLDGELFNVDAPVNEDTDLVAKFRAAGEVDKDELESAIIAAEARKDSVVIGTIASEVALGTEFVTQDVMTALEDAIADAKAAMASAETQADVTKALNDLNTALDIFEKAVELGTNENAPKPLTGTVTISGTAKYDETLTADVTGISPTAAQSGLTYEWSRTKGGTTTVIGTGSTYKLVEADIDATITVTVTAGTGYTGSKTSDPTATVAKADGPAAPSLNQTPCTADDDSDGKIAINDYDNTKTYEIRSKTGNTWGSWAEATVTAGVITVPAGTYEVRVKETTTHEAGTAAEITVSTHDVETFTVSITVINGTYTGRAETTVESGSGYSTIVTAGSGYKLPDSIIVIKGGNTLLIAGTGYTYDKSTGEIVITSVTGDVDITVICQADSTQPPVVNPPVTVVPTPTTPPTTTETKENEDGTTTTVVTDNTTGTVTETTKKEDGTVETVETKKDGTVTETTEKPDGSTEVVETKPDGTVTATSTDPEGGKVEKVVTPDEDVTITVTDPEGEVLAKVEIPAEIPASPIQFVDVPEEHWAEDAINQAAGLGLVNGVGDNLFNLNGNMERGDLAVILHRLSSEVIMDNDVTFDDVPAGAYYAESVAWAAAAGVVTGYSDTEFGPKDNITREQLAVMLYRYAQLLKLDTAVSGDGLDAFNDGALIHDWAEAGMAWCVENGIINGVGNGNLDPGSNATRAQVSVMLQRFMNLMKK